MKQYKPRDKITQKMSRDGLTEQNQTTGESAVSYTHLTLPTT